MQQIILSTQQFVFSTQQAVYIPKLLKTSHYLPGNTAPRVCNGLKLTCSTHFLKCCQLKVNWRQLKVNW